MLTPRAGVAQFGHHTSWRSVDRQHSASDVLASSPRHRRFPAPYDLSNPGRQLRSTCLSARSALPSGTRAASYLVWFRDEGLATRTPDVVPEPECHWCARESASCISGEVRDAHVPPSPRLRTALRVNGPRPSTVARPHRQSPPCGGPSVRPRDTLGRHLQPTLISFSSRAPTSRAATSTRVPVERAVHAACPASAGPIRLRKPSSSFLCATPAGASARALYSRAARTVPSL